MFERRAIGNLLSSGRTWGPKVTYSLVDQVIISTANFGLNIVLARWLSTTEYGAFAVAFSILLMLGGLEDALIVEPMSVLGPSRYKDQLSGYFGSVVRLHAGLTGGLAVVLAVGAFAVADEAWRGLWLTVGTTAPLIQLFWVLRRAAYVNGTPGVAVLGSGVYAATLTVTVLALWRFEWLSGATGFAAMGIAGIAGGSLSWRQLRVGRGSRAWVAPRLGFKDVLGNHWQYGRWLLAAAVLGVAGIQSHALLITAILGLEAAGTLRALQNFMLPMAHGLTAVAMLTLPVLARDVGQGNLSDARRKAALVTTGLVAVVVAYEIVLVLSFGPAEELIYGGKFAESAWLVPVLGVAVVLGALATGPSLMLRAYQRPEHYLVSVAAGAPVSLIATLGLTSFWGLTGAAASTIVPVAVGTGVAFYLYRAWVSADLDRRSGAARSADPSGRRPRGSDEGAVDMEPSTR